MYVCNLNVEKGLKMLMKCGNLLFSTSKINFFFYSVSDNSSALFSMCFGKFARTHIHMDIRANYLTMLEMNIPIKIS